MNSSRIPSFSKKRPSSSENMLVPSHKRVNVLDDVTNTSKIPFINKKMSAIDTHKDKVDPNVRLMNRYYYGDPNVIEEVKKRERKIMKDINHFRKSISEIEGEALLINDRVLPELKYNISKKSTFVSELRKELIQLITELDSKSSECDLHRKNGELCIGNLQLRHSVEAQKVKNELDIVMTNKRAEWEKKLLEIENYKPSVHMIEEIDALKIQRLEKQTELDRLQAKNREKCKEYEETLSKQFAEFVSEKEKPLIELRSKRDQLAAKRERLYETVRLLKDDVNECVNTKEITKRKIEEIRSEIELLKEENAPLEQSLSQLTTEYQLAESKTDEFRALAHTAEARYNLEFDKMEEEQVRRRKLENSIDELRGKIRCFAYVANDSLCNVDYATKEITLDGKLYYFNRVIPRELVSESDLFSQECQAYIERCLKTHTNCNIISISNNNKTLRNAFVRFITNYVGLGTLKENEISNINFQHVALCEDAVSIDMLRDDSRDPESEIKVKIEEKSVDMNSQRIDISNQTNVEDLLETVNTKPASNGIGILKFEVRNEKDKTHSDVYFVEINGISTSYLDDALSQTENMDSPIGIILQALLSRTMSLLLFDISSQEQEVEALLKIAEKASQLDNPKRRIALK